MADYPISNVPRRIVYTGSAGVGPYAFEFEVLTDTDINVYKNDDLLTLTADYTVSISPTLGTGTVTLVVAATSDDRITIVGSRPIERSTDFTTGGDFFANTLNVELDSQTILVQQVAETAERAIKAPVTDPTNIDMTLPINTARAGTFLGFDEDGNPIPGPAIASVGTISGNITSINTVANNIADVNTTATNIANVNTVAGISGNVTTVAGISGNVTSVAGNATNINTVATNIANVNATGSNIANVNAVAGNETNINAVNANKTNIDTVASVSGSVTTVAGISGNVTKVADVDADVTTVAGISGNVATVAGISGNVTTVAGNTTNINAVAANNTNISTVATNVSNVNVVAGNTTNINTVATNDSNITTVAGINADVSTVATNSANVTAVAANATNINTVAANNTNVTTVATNIASVNTNTANITAIQNASSNAINVANALTQVNSGQKDIFEDGTDFTTSVTDELTLSQTPAKANFVHVFFDTDYQASDTYTIVGNVITFDSAIVATKVEIVYDIATTLIEDALFNLADKRARAAFAREKNTPVIPTLLLDFEGDKELDPRVTFARASTARYYDGKTVAKAEENLLLRSEEFDTTVWGKTGSSVSANTETAPDGTATADSLFDNLTNNFHLVQQVSIAQVGVNTVSIYAKKNTLSFINVSFGTIFAVGVNLDTGAIVETVGSGAISTIIDAGNGWYRISLTATLATVQNVNIYASLNGIFSNRIYVGTDSSLFIWGAQLEQRSTVTAYTATTTQPITNYIPVLLSAANNEARFDHNPTTSESLGLLIEEQRTNLLVRSEEFGTTWTTVATTVSLNTVVAPNGTLTADKLVEDTTNASHELRQSATSTGGIAHTFSVFAKAGERGTLRMLLPTTGNSSGFTGGDFDLIAGTASFLAGTTGSIVTVGNGWYRCSITVTTAVGATTPQTRLVLGTTVYTGDGFSGIFIWGAQLEAGAFPTSYIPTEASQVTRSADAASMTGTNFSSWYRADEGSFYTEAVGVNSFAAATRRYLEVSIAGTATNRFILGYSNASSTRYLVVSNGATVADLAVSSGVPAGQLVKMSAGYRVDNFIQAANSTLSTLDTSGVLPTANAVQLGADNTNTANTSLNGHIRKFAFYPKRLTDTQLQAITT